MDKQVKNILKNIKEAKIEINGLVNGLIDDDNLFSEKYTELSQALKELDIAKQHIEFYYGMK